MYNPDEYAKSLLPRKQGVSYTNRTEFPKDFFQKKIPEATEEPLADISEPMQVDEDVLNGKKKLFLTTKGEMPTLWSTACEAVKLRAEEEKTGVWLYTRYYTWECSECKQNPTAGMGYVQSKEELFNYCPNCGVRMVGFRNKRDASLMQV